MAAATVSSGLQNQQRACEPQQAFHESGCPAVSTTHRAIALDDVDGFHGLIKLNAHVLQTTNSSMTHQGGWLISDTLC